MSAILQNKAFRLAWTSQCLYQLGSSFVEMTLIYRIGELSRSGFALPLLFFLLKFPVLFMGMISGVLVDRYDRRSLLVWSIGIRLIVTLIMAVLIWKLWALLTAVFVLALLGNLYRTSEGALIPEIVEKKDLTQAAGFFNMTEHGTTLLGLALVFGINGVLGNYAFMRGYESAVTFGIGAVLFAVGVYFQRQLAELPLNLNNTPPALPVKKEKQVFSLSGLKDSWFRLRYEMWEGFSYIRESIQCRRMVIHLVITNMVILTIISMASVFGAEYLLTVSMVEVGKFVILPILFGFVVAIAGLPYLHRHNKRMNIIAYSGMASAITILALGLFKLLFPWTGVEFWARWVIYFLIFVIGATAVGTLIPSYVILQEQSENRVRGRALGILFSTIVGLSALPLLLAGCVMENWGTVPLLIGLGVLLVLYAPTLFRYAKEE